RAGMELVARGEFSIVHCGTRRSDRAAPWAALGCLRAHHGDVGASSGEAREIRTAGVPTNSSTTDQSDEATIAALLRRLRAYAAMCAFGIYKLGQHSPEILLVGRHAEDHTLDAHIAVESLDIGDSE